MSREFKFRAWDKEDKRMIVDKQEFIPLLVTSAGVMRLSATHSGNLYSLQCYSRFDLMQYSGFKDVSGEELYDDDVVYLAGYGNYVVKHPYYELYEAAMEGDIGAKLGNLHQHPELLGGSKQQ